MINEKCCSVDRGRGICPFFRPHPGGFDSSRVPTPGNLPSKAKKMLMPGGQPGGGLGAGGIDWCITATNNKEFTGNSSLTSFCAESSEKKLGWSTIFHKPESVVKAKIAQNNSQVSEGGITVKPAWIDYLKNDPVCRLCNSYLACVQTSPNRRRLHAGKLVAGIKLHSNDQWIFDCNF